jgi:hypothetical protein
MSAPRPMVAGFARGSTLLSPRRWPFCPFVHAACQIVWRRMAADLSGPRRIQAALSK